MINWSLHPIFDLTTFLTMYRIKLFPLSWINSLSLYIDIVTYNADTKYLDMFCFSAKVDFVEQWTEIYICQDVIIGFYHHHFQQYFIYTVAATFIIGGNQEKATYYHFITTFHKHCTVIGATMPCPFFPKPWPADQPIFCNNLLPIFSPPMPVLVGSSKLQSNELCQCTITHNICSKMKIHSSLECICG